MRPVTLLIVVMESELATAIVRIYKQHLGRGPTRASAEFAGDTVVIRLRDTLTRTERLLMAAGHAELVSETRDRLAELARPAIQTAAARITGRAVRSSSSSLELATDTATEEILLGPARVRSRSAHRGSALQARGSRGSVATRNRPE